MFLKSLTTWWLIEINGTKIWLVKAGLLDCYTQTGRLLGGDLRTSLLNQTIITTLLSIKYYFPYLLPQKTITINL